MPVLTLRGTWFGGGCIQYSSAQYGDYANLGVVSHTNHSIIWGEQGLCSGWYFNIKDNISNTIIFSTTSLIVNKQLELFYDGEPPPPSQIQYDCINGACTPRVTYNTPGLYQSLEECEVNCGSQGCSGKCISNSEWSQIEGLSNQLKSKNCS